MRDRGAVRERKREGKERVWWGAVRQRKSWVRGREKKNEGRRRGE